MIQDKPPGHEKTFIIQCKNRFMFVVFIYLFKNLNKLLKMRLFFCCFSHRVS